LPVNKFYVVRIKNPNKEIKRQTSVTTRCKTTWKNEELR
jgi:hypothetical protein